MTKPKLSKKTSSLAAKIKNATSEAEVNAIMAPHDPKSFTKAELDHLERTFYETNIRLFNKSLERK